MSSLPDFSRGQFAIPQHSNASQNDLSSVSMVDDTYRVQMGSRQPGPEPQAPQSRVKLHLGEGPTRIINGEIEQSAGHFSGNSFHDLIHEGGDYLRTARSQTGSPVVGRELRPDDIVMVAGMETTVAIARRLGLVEENEYGKLVNGADARKLVEEPIQEAVETGEAFASQDDEKHLAEMSALTSAGPQVAAINDFVTTGQMSSNTIERLASEAGMEPHQVQENFAKVQAAFTAQAKSVVTKTGVPDFDDFSQWAWQHQPNSMQDAIRAHTMHRSTAGYQAIAAEYVATMDQHDPHAILEADFGGGITASKAPNGNIVLNIPGTGQVSWRQAINLGLVKVSRR
jgi:hypothetical protein